MRKFGILVAALAVLASTAPVLAHHGFDTEYDAKKHVKLTGVVTRCRGPTRTCASTSTSPVPTAR